MAEPRSSSLTQRLLLALVAPMAGIALLLGIGGALTIDNIVEGVNDRLLVASARAISETLAVERGEVTLDLPLFALGMLENESRDNVYYSVRAGGRLLTGYKDLPVVAEIPATDGEARFDYAAYRNAPIRIAAVARRLPRVQGPVVVEVAETLEARHVLRNRMLTALAVLEALLLGLVALLMPVAVRWGLAPVARVRRHMAALPPDDLSPLPLSYVPSELRSLIVAFNGLLARVESAVRGMRQFTADASHQMRTPLSILRAHLAVLRTAGSDSDVGRSSLDDIEAATGRLQRLLTQLLALARADSARQASPPFRPTDIVALTRKVAEEYAPVALRADVDLVFESDLDHLVAYTSADLAVELVGNLIDNAIRYNRTGGDVVISVSERSAGVAVVIEDDGPGIRPEDHDAVFTRFRRLDRDQSSGGSGLGLAIVKALADRIGATVILGARDGLGGLRVEVLFPATG